MGPVTACQALRTAYGIRTVEVAAYLPDWETRDWVLHAYAPLGALALPPS